MPNFSIALSGLSADTQALNTIANNLSNMSSVAYKSKTASFSDMFYQNIGSNGSGDLLQVGAGTKISTTSTNYTQGSSDTTSKSNSDMEISGDGFFVVSDGSQNYLTRNGQFTENTSGTLQTANNDTLMGYAATNGVVSATTLSAITLPTKGAIMSPSVSTEFTIQANLNSADATGTAATSSVNLYDSLGTEHQATVTYTKSATANTWNYSIALPASDFASGTSTPVTGTLTFDSTGKLSTLTTLTPTAGTATTVGTATGDVSTVAVGFSGLADGANNLSTNWNLLSSSGGQIITQVASGDKTTSAIADGYAAGTYSSFTVASDGSVNASYSNGKTVLVGKVALADVANQEGLDSLGSSLYKTTTASGDANVGTAGSGSLGTITDAALEQSNVDISTEFSQLIIAQRAFEANSKSITTFDTVTQETINIIH